MAWVMSEKIQFVSENYYKKGYNKPFFLYNWWIMHNPTITCIKAYWFLVDFQAKQIFDDDD